MWSTENKISFCFWWVQFSNYYGIWRKCQCCSDFVWIILYLDELRKESECRGRWYAIESRLNFLCCTQRLKTNCSQIEIISMGSQMSTTSFRIGVLFKTGNFFHNVHLWKWALHKTYLEPSEDNLGLLVICHPFMSFISTTIIIVIITIIIKHLLIVMCRCEKKPYRNYTFKTMWKLILPLSSFI